MKQHKWHKEIKAWADGGEIQFKDSHDVNEWLDTDEPFWDCDEFVEYRIKPQPKEPQYLYVYKVTGQQGFEYKLWNSLTGANGLIGKIKLEQDDETMGAA